MLEMADERSCCLLLAAVSLLVVCSYGTHVGGSFRARGELRISSEVRTVTFCRQNEVPSDEVPVCGSSVHLFLNGSVVEKLIVAGSSGVSLLESSTRTSFHRKRFDGIVLDFGNRNGDLYEILFAVRSVYEVVGGMKLDNQLSMKLSVVFSAEFLEKLGRDYERDQLHSLFNSFETVLSMVIVDVEEENSFRIASGTGAVVASSLAERAISVGSVVPPDKFALSVLIRGPTPPSLSEVAEFSGTASKYLQRSSHSGVHIAELYVDVSGMKLYERRDRKLLDAIPITTPDTSTPTIVTVPGTAPLAVTPNIPLPTPATIPSTTPVFYPPTNPVNPTVPIANPAVTVPGAATQPVTNPVTNYPSPPASAVPVTAPITNPVGSPAITNEPAIPGQSWCTARTGVTDAALQVAIDYACGLGGADCSQIQEGASCYIPNTLQNHASYAFNSYYQRNPVATSCDFGGTAVIVNSNPSTGSCIYSNSASVATPETVGTPSTTTASSSSTPTTVAPLTSSGTPPAEVNPVTGTPLGFTTESPQAMNSSTSRSIALVPSCHIVILTSLLSAKFMVRR